MSAVRKRLPRSGAAGLPRPTARHRPLPPPNLSTLQYEAVIDYPTVFAEPWMLSRTFPFLPERNRLDEFYCENNRDYRELFGSK